MNPTLSGAEKGRVCPVRTIAGGVWLLREDALINQPAAIRLLRQRENTRCQDLARQYLACRGDGSVSLSALSTLANLLAMHLALVTAKQPGIAPQPLYPGILAPLSDEKGKLVDNASAIIESLPLQDLADGQLEMLANEYDLLRATETPATITHEQWEALVSQVKKSSLRTHILQHGCSALIQVLHGTPAERWQE